ncbi:MAG: hypothetical protein JXB10_17720 [Pirellulales bacterium]|nr:hypothetical protein [Pirellulales bacterium]
MYRNIIVGWFLTLSVLAAAPLWGQSRSDRIQDLQRQMQNLQEALDRLESGPQEKSRITQLGTSRVPAAEREEVLVVRVYDLSDLFVVAPPYPATYPNNTGGESLIFPGAGSEYTGAGGMMGMGGMGGMGGGGMGAGGRSGRVPHGAGGGGMFNIDSPPAAMSRLSPQIPPQMLSSGMGASCSDSVRVSMGGLIDVITTTISPSAWTTLGGECSIDSLGNVLVVSATKNIHEQIASLITAFRKRWGTLRTVSVEAHWLWMNESWLNRLLAESHRRSSGDDIIFGLIDEAVWTEICDKLAKTDAYRVGYQSVITGFNGQTVSTVSGGLQRFIVDMIPVVGQQIVQTPPPPTPSQAVGYQPVTATIQEGAALQVTPMVSIGGKYVTLDVHSRVLQVQEDKAARSETTSVVQDLAAAVDRPRITNYHLATTLRIPSGRRMLVGGMTFEGVSATDQPNLYLFVKVQVQELRDEAVEARPDAENVEKK